MILITVKQKAKPEHAERWPELMAGFTAATRGEEGNISFEWFRSADDPHEWLLVEVFRDAAAGAAHVASAHFHAAMEVLPTLLAAQPEIIHIDGAGDGWSTMAEIQVNSP